jgi:hypothetical protein
MGIRETAHDSRSGLEHTTHLVRCSAGVSASSMLIAKDLTCTKNLTSDLNTVLYTVFPIHFDSQPF